MRNLNLNYSSKLFREGGIINNIFSYEIKRMLPKELLAIQKFVEDYEDWS